MTRSIGSPMEIHRFLSSHSPYMTKPLQIPWAQGFSTYQPMQTNGGFNFDNGTGSFSATPTTQGIDLLKFRVNEYRHDSINGQWYFVGSID
ncbi:MAG: hypothetical protein U5L96_04040 [Owenweeksia sp.]|nr:hypothetical protein [Owenweeksia sp.]